MSDPYVVSTCEEEEESQLLFDPENSQEEEEDDPLPMSDSEEEKTQQVRGFWCEGQERRIFDLTAEDITYARDNQIGGGYVDVVQVRNRLCFDENLEILGGPLFGLSDVEPESYLKYADQYMIYRTSWGDFRARQQIAENKVCDFCFGICAKNCDNCSSK